MVLFFHSNFVKRRNTMKISHNSLLQDFTQLQKIGEGLTSTVYKGNHSQMGQTCLKVIDAQFYSKTIGKLLIDNQISILKSIDHKNLLKLKKHHQNQQENIIITQFCEGGNLYDIIKRSQTIKEEKAFKIAKSIVNGLQQLRRRSIVHRDLKPQNIFFKNGQPIIADFGFAVRIQNKVLHKINAGSPLYMAPEALSNLQFSFQSDIFAFGVIVYEMLKGKTPWTAVSEKQLAKNMSSIKPSLQLSNKEFSQLILKCLQAKRQNRPNLQQIYNFFKYQHETKALKANQKEQKKEPIFLYEITNITKSKQEKKPTNNQLYRLNFKQNHQEKQNKQNIDRRDKSSVLNETLINTKTHRLEVQSKLNTRVNKSLMLQNDSTKTKRGKLDKNNQNFMTILTRLDPQKMKFLPLSMIEKFKFILVVYEKVLSNKNLQQGEISIPKGLKSDKIALEVVNCKQQKQLCSIISGYVGRMYRLAKNYKICHEFSQDIEVLYERVERFS